MTPGLKSPLDAMTPMPSPAWPPLRPPPLPVRVRDGDGNGSGETDSDVCLMGTKTGGGTPSVAATMLKGTPLHADAAAVNDSNAFTFGARKKDSSALITLAMHDGGAPAGHVTRTVMVETMDALRNTLPPHVESVAAVRRRRRAALALPGDAAVSVVIDVAFV